MAGKFINTSYKDVVNSITDITKDILKNPYYLYSDKKGVETTYYHINDKKSTLDEAARIPYSDLGPDCPFRFNCIKGLFIFGLDRIQLSLENGDIGLQSGEIAGESYIIPGTIVPYVGDYFELSHVNDTWLFRVNEVNKDTLDDGANIWKISYRIEYTDNSKILPLVDKEDNYTVVVNNIGTEYNAVIKDDSYKLLEAIDAILLELKRYYRELFYSNRVQTFVFVHWLDDRFYDPFMIEFIRRNKLMENSGQEDYIYIDHKLKVPNTFSLDYNRTFFRSFEIKDKHHLLRADVDTTADYISNPVSIFNSRAEDYFELNHKVYNYDNVRHTPHIKYHNVMNCFPHDVAEAIHSKDYLTGNKAIYNIFIKYFNDIDIDSTDISTIENIDYLPNIETFFYVPLCIFCLEEFVRNRLLR